MKAGTWLALGLLLAAAAIRLAGIDSQLWLDEIWSIRLAQKAGSPLGVFFLHHDNNHWLNTLWLYCLGAGRPWWTYHLLCETCGIGTVLLGWLISRRSLAVLILLATSEFLVEYSTDARGYAPAQFFAVLCVWLFQNHLARPRRTTAVLMALSAMLGLLSHLTFAAIGAGLIAASLVVLTRRRSWGWAVAQTAVWWFVPAGMLAALYLIDVRYMVRGGGPPTPGDLPAQAAAMMLGIPLGSPAAHLFGTIAFVLCGARVWRLFRDADPLWPFYLTLLLFVVGILFLWPRTDYLHPRYVAVAAPLLFVLLGSELQTGLSRQGLARAAAVGALAAFCIANIVTLVTFLRLGRGDYLGALRFMLANTASAEVVVGADRHPPSTLMVLQYYDDYHVPPGRPVATLRGEQWGDQWPQWLLAEEDVGPTIVTTDGVPFARRADFPNGAVTSGIPWTVYEALAGRAYVRPQSLRELSP